MERGPPTKSPYGDLPCDGGRVVTAGPDDLPRATTTSASASTGFVLFIGLARFIVYVT